MAKKKAHHLYEILGKPGEQQTPLPQQAPLTPQQIVQMVRKEERVKPPEPLLCAGLSTDKALENVIIIRKDTAVVGILFVVVIWVAAFLVGRSTAPKTHASVSPTLKGASSAPETPSAPQMPAASPAESAPVQPAPVKEKYYLMIAAYAESKKKEADDAAAFLKSKGYPVVVEKSGDKYAIRLRNFQSKSDVNALKTLGEIASLEYKGRKEFSTAYFVEVKQ